jgi:GNAT superfamily N-acetyltransferase
MSINRPVSAEWSNRAISDEYEGAVNVRLYIENTDRKNTHFSGDFISNESSTRETLVHGLDLRVHPELRGNGYATRMVSALAFLALRESAHYIEIPVESPYVLKIFAHLFQDEALQFIDSRTHNDASCELPMTTSQAIDSLTRAGEFEPDLEHREHGVIVRAALSGVNRAWLNPPIEVNSKDDIK